MIQGLFVLLRSSLHFVCGLLRLLRRLVWPVTSEPVAHNMVSFHVPLVTYVTFSVGLWIAFPGGTCCEMHGLPVRTFEFAFVMMCVFVLPCAYVP